MRYQEFMDYIKVRFNLQEYGLQEGFNKFESRVCGALDEVVRMPFEWRDNDKNDVTVYVTIENVPTEFEDGEPVSFEKSYYAFNSQY